MLRNCIAVPGVVCAHTRGGGVVVLLNVADLNAHADGVPKVPLAAGERKAGANASDFSHIPINFP